MATITNARDVLLQAAPTRVAPAARWSSAVVDWSAIVGLARPQTNADVTADVLNAGVTVNAVGGGLTLDTAGAVRGGQTAYNTGVGFFLGYQEGAYRVSLGNPQTGQFLRWDGYNLTLAGALDYGFVTGTRPPANADNTSAGLNAGVTVTAGGLTLAGGAIRAGQTDFSVGAGFYLGWQTSVVRISLGNAATGQSLTWDGTSLKMAGEFAGRITTGVGRGSDGGAFSVAADGSCFVSNLTCENILTTNFTRTFTPALHGVTMGPVPAVFGQVAFENPTTGSSYMAGVRGHNAKSGSGGAIAMGNGFDFYADGIGTNYGPFTGTHDALTLRSGPAITPGQIVVDTTLIERSGWSGTLFEVELSSQANQAGVLGVVCAPAQPLSAVQPSAFIEEWAQRPSPPHEQGAASQAQAFGLVTRMKPSYWALQDSHDHLAVNALGEGQLLVCGEGGDIARGDLIVTSSTPGVGMRQADNLVRSVTVAKAREALVFAEGAAPQPLACIYLCG